MYKNDKLKTLLKVIIGVVIFIIIMVYLLISTIVNYVTDDQRAIDWNASQMYQEAVESYEAGNYDEALLKLDSIDSTWSKVHKVSALKAEVVREVLLEDASALMNEGKHEEVLEYITTHVEDPSSDSTIQEIYDQAADIYREEVLTLAYNTYTEYGSEGPLYAMDLLNTALAVMPEDEIIESEIAEYEACVGNDLVLMEPYYQGNDISGFTDSITDVNGISYGTGISAYLSPLSTDDSYACWRLDGEYDRLTATVLVRSGDQDRDGTARFTVYADDVPICTKSITKDTKTFNLDLNIADTDVLKIEAYGGCGPYDIEALACVLADVYVSKVKAEPLYYQ